MTVWVDQCGNCDEVMRYNASQCCSILWPINASYSITCHWQHRSKFPAITLLSTGDRLGYYNMSWVMSREDEFNVRLLHKCSQYALSVYIHIVQTSWSRRRGSFAGKGLPFIPNSMIHITAGESPYYLTQQPWKRKLPGIFGDCHAAENGQDSVYSFLRG